MKRSTEGETRPSQWAIMDDMADINDYQPAGKKSFYDVCHEYDAYELDEELTLHSVFYKPGTSQAAVYAMEDENYTAIKWDESAPDDDAVFDAKAIAKKHKIRCEEGGSAAVLVERLRAQVGDVAPMVPTELVAQL